MSKKEPKKKPGLPKFGLSWIYLSIFVGLLALQFFSNNYSGQTLDSNFSDLKEKISKGHVSLVEIVNKNHVLVYLNMDTLASNEDYKEISKTTFGDSPNPGPHYQFTAGDNFEEKIWRFYDENPDVKTQFGEVNVQHKTETNYWTEVLSWIVPFALIAFFWFFMMRRMGGGSGGGPGAQIFNIGKSKAQMFDADAEVRITFQNVAGMEGAKDEVLEVVDFLKNPKKYTNLGGKIPKGVLLSGPPGTGKNFIGKSRSR
jgi:cell division protease FtsH